MNSRIWKIIVSMIRSVNREMPRSKRPFIYSDVLIASMYVWSVWHDRPRTWATHRSNYYGSFRPQRLPSRSQFLRRINSSRCRHMIDAVCKNLAQSGDPQLSFVDGHALSVRRHTTDPDARVGRSVGGYGKGYKLHAYVTQDGFFKDFEVTPLNVCEKKVAHRLLLDQPRCGVVLGDAFYDDAKLFEAARRRGGRFIAPPREGAGQGHVPQSPARLAAIAHWPRDKKLYEKRRAVERYFGQLVCFGGGLHSLPSWVRRLSRVKPWITAKIAIYHARILARVACENST